MPRKKIIQPTTAAPVKSYKHDSKRARIPTQEESVKLSAMTLPTRTLEK
ncbi:MAG: hypothetical protein V1892_01315 [bacterium]